VGGGGGGGGFLGALFAGGVGGGVLGGGVGVGFPAVAATSVVGVPRGTGRKFRFR